VQKVRQQLKENLKYTLVRMQICTHQEYVQEESNLRRMARKKGLREWVKEKWVDIGAPKKDGKYQPCGRSKGSKRKYPKCVPLAKAKSMTAAQKRSAVARKRAAGNKGPKPTNVRTFAKK
jgi:hypothetical protein